MTLSDIILIAEYYATKQPAIHQIVQNDIFRLNGRADANYGVFGWTQGIHRGSLDDDLRTYVLTLFFIDRMTEDRKNQLAIQSIGIEVLDNILRSIADNEEIGVSDHTFTTFNQRFVDECAGVYCNVELTAPIDSVCSEDYDLGIYLADVAGYYLTDSEEKLLTIPTR